MKRRLLRLLAIPVVPISVLLLAVGVWAAWRVQYLQEHVSREMRENASALRAAEELEILVREFRTRLEHFRTSGDRRDLEALGAFREGVDHWLPQAERWSLTPREQQLTGQARRAWQSLQTEFERLAGRPAELTPEAYARVDRLLADDLLSPIHEFLDLNEEDVERSVAANQAAADGLVFGLLLLGVCGAGAGLAGGFWLARRFVARLERSERAALRAEQLAALGHLAAGMAHELHNPLTTIKMLVQSALTQTDFGEGQMLAGHDLAVVDEEVTRLEGLVRSFLDFARPPAPERRVVEAGALVEQTLELVTARAAAAGATVALDRPPGPVRSAVDPGQLRQVVLNLVLNALDVVKANGRIEVQLRQGKDGALTLRVADNGPGLPADLGQRIFDPFVTGKETGLGLGLSICKRIAEAHGGSITGANRPGGGAEFVVRLPAL